MSLRTIREEIKQSLVEALTTNNDEQRQKFSKKLEQFIELPPREEFGDLTLKCFGLQEEYEVLSAKEIADMVVELVKLPEYITAKAVNGFVNFSVDQMHLAKTTIDEVFEKGENYGRINIGEGKKVIVEYSSPNYGKELHVGHIRSTLVGDVLSRIFSASGYNVIRINYPGDVGGHMGKVIAGINKWNNGKLPENPQEAMKVMSKLYTQFSKESTDELLSEATRITKAIEEESKLETELWELVTKLSAEEHAVLYKRLGVEFDLIQRASSVTKRGKELVELAREKELTSIAENGSTSVNSGGLGYIKVLATDGTAVYGTLDTGAAITRFEEFNFDKMVYVVGVEQQDYFKKLFKFLEKVGYEKAAERCEHLATGHLVLEEGKMSSREGNVILLEDVINMVVENARSFIKNRAAEKGDAIEEEKINEIAETIGIGALKYLIHTVDPCSNMVYTSKKALSLQGKSAPFALYAYTRAGSILTKSEGYDKSSFRPEHLQTKEEIGLVKCMSELPIVVEGAARSYKPQFIADYIYRLGSAFNLFYTNVPILKEKHGNSIDGCKDNEVKNSRLCLIAAFRQTMYNALTIFGIKTLEKM